MIRKTYFVDNFKKNESDTVKCFQISLCKSNNLTSSLHFYSFKCTYIHMILNEYFVDDFTFK